MAFEYIETIEQNNYTVIGATDEAYPTFDPFEMYPKSEVVIYKNKIYKARQTISLPTYYVYNKEEKALYIPAKDTFVETATFNPTSEFENRFIFLDDTDTLYKYIGLTEITIDPTTINFEDTLLWENQGKQLNGYIVELSYPDVSPLYWEDMGYVNTRRAFDESSSSQTISNLNEDLVFTFQTGNIDRIALFGVSAKEIKIKVKLGIQPESPENTIEKIIPLYTQTGEHFYEILTSTIVFKKTCWLKIPTSLIQTITLTFTNQTYAKVGDITLGRGKILGATLDSVNYDIKDNSIYGSDTGGSDSYIEGGYRKINDFTVSYLTRDTSTVLKSLDSLRGKITVFNLSNEENRDFLRIKGFMRTRPLNYISNSRKSKINIKVEGRLND